MHRHRLSFHLSSLWSLCANTDLSVTVAFHQYITQNPCQWYLLNNMRQHVHGGGAWAANAFKKRERWFYEKRWKPGLFWLGELVCMLIWLQSINRLVLRGRKKERDLCVCMFRRKSILLYKDEAICFQTSIPRLEITRSLCLLTC